MEYLVDELKVFGEVQSAYRDKNATLDVAYTFLWMFSRWKSLSVKVCSFATCCIKALILEMTEEMVYSLSCS